MSRSPPDTPQTKEVHLCAYKARKPLIPPVPLHWIFERDGHSKYHGHFCWRPFTHFLHHLFCVIGLGHASLNAVWERCYEDCPDEVWEHFRDELRERMEHINVVAGLLISAMAAFCTTDPPADARLLPYTNTASYCAIFLSVNLALGGLVVGSTTAFVIHKASAKWFHEAMMGSQPRICATMVLLSYPFLSVGASTCVAATGLLIATSRSGVTWINIYGYIFAFPPVLCGLVFGWMICVKSGALALLMLRHL